MKTIPKSPIVDTGPLFDFLLWRFAVYFNISNLLSKDKLFRYLSNDLHRKSVLWYFTIAKPLTTCPEVIAEIHRHAEENLRGNWKAHLGKFWKFAQQELKELGLREELVELIHMDGATLSILGPTDTALLQIASDVPNLGKTIFTEDGKLARQCRDKQVRILRVADVLSIWQQFESKG